MKIERFLPQPLSEKIWRLNWLLLLSICALSATGVVALYSVADGSLAPWAERHAIRTLIGLALIIGIAMLPLRFWLAAAYPVYFLALALLLAVLFGGTQIMGARRWIAIGALSFQPSEIMKVALVLALARYYLGMDDARISRPLWVFVPLLVIAVPVVLVLKQPDLGTAAILASVGLGMMFLAGVSLWYFAAAGVAVAAAGPIIWANLHSYQQSRILTFLDPQRDPLGAGYHITQSKIALGSGGLYGKGFMQGTQSKLDFLPEKHTDFIFTMFAEEMGFIGSISLLALYALLFLVLAYMALSCRNQFSRLLIGGAWIGVFVYSLINIAMVTGLVPVVGVPLPLVSYGGTSMLTIMFGLGTAMCGYVHRYDRLRRSDLRIMI